MNPEVPVLIVGGSRAYDLCLSTLGRERERRTVETPFGPSAPIRILEIEDRTVGFLSRHGETGYRVTAPWINYRANIYAAKELGVTRIVAWSGPGAIHPGLRPGDLVLPHDLIDLTRQRPSTFYAGRGIGFIRQNPVFCPEVREALRRGLEEAGVACHAAGTYVCTEGPRLETPAEVRFMAAAGGELVGMTLVPEVFLARELEICYAAICYVSNYAEGVRDLPYRPGLLFEGTLPSEEARAVEETLARLPGILARVLDHLDPQTRNCPCKDAMLRYRERGDIGEDWHTWVARPGEEQRS